PSVSIFCPTTVITAWRYWKARPSGESSAAGCPPPQPATSTKPMAAAAAPTLLRDLFILDLPISAVRNGLAGYTNRAERRNPRRERERSTSVPPPMRLSAPRRRRRDP